MLQFFQNFFGCNPQADDSRGVTTKDLITFKQAPISNHYTLDQSPIGIGSISIVKKGTHRLTGQIRAIRILKKSQINEEKLRKEIKILKNLDHPNILKIYEVIYDTENFYIVSDLCTGKELFEHIEKKGIISEEFAARIMKELLSAITYLHNNGIAHLNIKPESLRFESELKEGMIKITNFANADSISDYEPFKDFVGTPEYVAPEMIDGLYNNSVDVWACGITLFMILVGQAPFTGKNKQAILKAIKENPLEFKDEIWKEVSVEAKDLITKMLNKDLSQRITAQDALNHEWFKAKLTEKKIDRQAACKTLERLKSFRINKKIQSAIWTFMEHYLATKEEKGRLLEIFQALDTNNDGQLSKEELKEGFDKFFVKGSKVISIDKIFKNLDKNHNETIDYTEFVTAVLDKDLLISQDNLRITFNLLDADGNGKISIQELQDAFGAESVFFEEAYWKELVKEADREGDGEIGFNEFVELMAGLKV